MLPLEGQTGKTIIGIDPTKGKQQTALLDPDGLPIGNR